MKVVVVVAVGSDAHLILVGIAGVVVVVLFSCY